MKKYLIVILALVLAVGGADAQKKGGKSAGAGGPSKATGSIYMEDYVDLGLPSGLVWATHNVGAKSPEEYGDYFAWGYTSPRSDYEGRNVKTLENNIFGLRYYEYLDENNVLTPAHDAARANWGSTWRMPTWNEFLELHENTTQKTTTYKGVKGCLFTSKKNGKSIFIPAAGLEGGGMGIVLCCWTSSVESEYKSRIYAYYVGKKYSYYYDRSYGMTIRPVSEPPTHVTPKQTESMAASGKIADHEYVDLGLPSGLKWATCNIGAGSPDSYGDYFAWSETTTKDGYYSNTCVPNRKSDSWLEDNCYIDNSRKLTPEHDAAYINWGSSWRMPTAGEIKELIENTTSVWIRYNDVDGRLITSKINGKSIFLPAAGYYSGKELYADGGKGFYFSSTPSTNIVKTEKAFNLFINHNNYEYDDGASRACGIPIRPVSDGKEPALPMSEAMAASGEIDGHEYVDLGLPSGLKWATCNVGASAPKDYGDYFAWGETTTKSSYDEDNCPAYKKDDNWLLLNGYTDVSGNLSKEHDAASINWGSEWRMPSEADIKELIENTTSRWIMYNGVKGRLITSKINKKSIFIPDSRYRKGESTDDTGSCLCSSTPNEKDADYAYSVKSSFDGFSSDNYKRYYGMTIRPVADGKAAAPTLTESIAPTAVVGGHEYVDLGLPSGVKWATCNIGATAPEGYGDYFAWGETKTKKNYDKSSTDKKDNEWLKKKGYIDDSGNLTPKYDAATAQWGAIWRMPSKAEIDELVENTTTMWITYNGVKGRLVTSKINNKSIFLPAAGYRNGKELVDGGARAFYFSSTPHESKLEKVNNLFFNLEQCVSGNGAARSCGHSVRPVTK